MKIVVSVKLQPTLEVASALRDELHGCNQGANWVSEVAYATYRLKAREYALRKLVYTELRERGIKSAAAQQLIKKVVDAYTTLRANIKAGNLGPEGSKRRVKAESKPIVFREDAAQAYDHRNMGWDIDAQTVAITTRTGRMKGIPFVCSPEALKTLAQYRKGEADLLCCDGSWYVIATCDVPEPEVYKPDGFIGVDLGIENIATTSTGYQAAGRKLNRYRKRQLFLRQKLQKKGTKSAKRLLKKRSRKEARHVKNTNHIVSKTIVTEAERTGRGICLEELKGIRNRVRLRKPQRVALHSWSFAQLGDFIVYKAKRAGVPLVFVNAAYTSQMCCECQHIDKCNRVDQGLFTCRGCGVVAHADRNASHNLAQRGETVWNAGRESRVPATRSQV
ncbi:RNA-guided endonuclease InsQ/TnpB family protein [Streptomyces sp. NPDC001339]|uniref:RNA-guided endonuclease InsQ/TnpB family protein n=1 Tax=Streptomyces sp. NPDC001339 TaxID=3364563 RepID=UPI0036A56380